MKLTKYKQLKHKMRVRCKINGKEIKDAKLSIDEDGDVFICQDVQGGFSVKNKLGYEYSYHLCWQKDKEMWDNEVKDLQSYKTGLRDMEIGDIIIDDYEDERKVLDIREEIFFMSEEDDFDAASGYWTFKEAEDNGWKLEGVEKEETNTVEFEGKTYDRAEFEKRLKKLKPISD